MLVQRVLFPMHWRSTIIGFQVSCWAKLFLVREFFLTILGCWRSIDLGNQYCCVVSVRPFVGDQPLAGNSCSCHELTESLRVVNCKMSGSFKEGRTSLGRNPLLSRRYYVLWFDDRMIVYNTFKSLLLLSLFPQMKEDNGSYLHNS